MIRLFAPALLVTALLSSVSFGQDYAVAIPDNAKWHAHIDARALLKSQAADLLRKKFLAGDGEKKLMAFRDMMGVDPTTDLTRIAAYGKGFDDKDTVLMIGAKTVGHVVALVESNPDYEYEEVDGYEVHSWIEDKPGHHHRQYGIIIDATDGKTVIITHDQALAVKTAKTLDAAKKDNGKLRNRPMFHLHVADLPGAMAHDAESNMMQLGQTLTLTANERDGRIDIAASVTTAGGQEAADVKQLADGMLALARLNGRKMPLLAEYAGKVRTSIRDSTVTAEASVEARQLVGDMEQLHRQFGQHKHGK